MRILADRRHVQPLPGDTRSAVVLLHREADYLHDAYRRTNLGQRSLLHCDGARPALPHFIQLDLTSEQLRLEVSQSIRQFIHRRRVIAAAGQFRGLVTMRETRSQISSLPLAAGRNRRSGGEG